jgi:3-phosphoshikimate 1-carboxyvinyltransferase
MTVHGGQLHGVEWRSDVASAQIKSAVLLAALVAGVESTVDEPERSRDHTERMLAARGVTLELSGTRVHIAPGGRLDACDAVVPGDPSSAAFFAGLAAIASAGSIELPDVGINPTRTGFFEVLRRMGARVEVQEERDEGGEPTATIVAAPGELHGTTVGGAEVPTLIDELPLVACLATRAAGETVITGAAELRVKESDRIKAVVDNLRAIGADAEELPDGMRIRGGGGPLRGRVVTHGDHRLAMAFGILGAVGGNAIEVDDPACADVSYPAFWSDLARVAGA